jgi:hypothetical protein
MVNARRFTEKTALRDLTKEKEYEIRRQEQTN